VGEERKLDVGGRGEKEKHTASLQAALRRLYSNKFGERIRKER
jgi:hypothetical protein